MRIDNGLIARNTAINVVGLGVPLVIAAVCIPIVVNGLGAVRFGLLSLAWAVLSFSGELGMGRATTKFAATYAASGDDHGVARVTWATAGVQLAIGLVLALLLAAFAPMLAETGLKVPAELVGETRACLYLLAALVPVVLVTGAFRGTLEAAQRFDLVNAVRLPASAATFLLPLVGVLAQMSVAQILAMLLAARVAALVGSYVLAARVFPALSARPTLERGELVRLIHFGGWATVSSVLGPAIIQIERVLLGMIVAVSAVGYYTPAYEMVTRLAIISASLIATVFPALSTLTALSDRSAVERLLTTSVKYITLSLGPVLLLVAIFAPDILRLWLSPEYAVQSTLPLRILAVGVLVNAFALVPFSLLQSVGRADVTGKLQLVELPLQVILAYVLIRTWGITGAALAWTLRCTFDALLLAIAAQRVTAFRFSTMDFPGIPAWKVSN